MSDYLKDGFIDEVKGCLINDGSGSGQANIIESIKVNGVNQSVNSNKSVDIPVPTKTSDLDNDSGYMTEDQVNSKVTEGVNVILEDVGELKNNLDSQGLLNKFDGKLEQGHKNASGTIVWDSTNVCIKNTISVSSGDKVTVKLDSVATRLYTTYRNNGVFVSEEINYNTNNATVTIPSGANGLDITMVYDSTTTPSQVENLYVYINNAIEELNNDLGGLSLSASGTTLTITDGTNAWTLEAN